MGQWRRTLREYGHTLVEPSTEAELVARARVDLAAFDMLLAAYREREDDQHSPAEVLAWVCGRQVTPEELHRIFYSTRLGRRLTRNSYVRFRHWRLYGEPVLAGETVAIWLYGEHLTIAFADEALAQYAVAYGTDRHQLAAVVETRLFETPYRSPQLPLWERHSDEWITVIRSVPYAPRPRQPHSAWQSPCLELFG